MSVDAPPLEISNHPELLRLVEEVNATNKPRLLKRQNTPLALLTPVKKTRRSEQKTSE
jgi:hypothetical protein